MLHSRRRRGDRQRGQILVLFELVLIVILAVAALVIDGGVLRNNRQILVNTLDAAALAGGHYLPVDSTNYGNANQLMVQTIQANYPGLPSSSYTITYRCLVGVDPTNNQAWVSRDVPSTCNPSHAVKHTAVPSDFTGAGQTQISPCDPALGDKCNVVVIEGSATTQYKLAPVIGLASGSTGSVVSAACAGPCGQATVVPVDLVVIIDRTASMSATDVTATRTAADAILSVYDPNIQRVAMGFLGPSSSFRTCSGPGGPAVPVDMEVAGTLTAPKIPGTGTQNIQSVENGTGGASALKIPRPTSTAVNDLLVAGITVDGGTATTITPPAGWTLIRRTNNGANVGIASFYKVAVAADTVGGVTYSFGISPNARASGGILRYTGENPSNPINSASSSNSATSGTSVRALSITPTSAQTAIVGFFGTDTHTTFTKPAGTTEQFDVQNQNGAGPSTEAATDTQATATSTGDYLATAGASGPWASVLIAINPAPVDTYGTSTSTDLSNWIPIGFSGTDSLTPPPTYNEAYSDTSTTPYTLNPSSHVVSAIACFDAGYYGTNLTTPINMASYYLQHYGRPNVTWGILLETDGYPQYMNTGDTSNYTCTAANAAATAAKAVKNAKGQPIQLFTVGFGLDNTSGGNPTCPDSWHPSGTNKARDLLASMATQPSANDIPGGCPGRSGDFFCVLKSSDTTALADVFSKIAYEFAN